MGRFYRDARVCGAERPTAPIDLPGASELSFVQGLLTPGHVFDDPREIVQHPWFTDEEKRSILTSWARVQLMVEQRAQSRGPKLQPELGTDVVLEALARFDASAAGEYLSAVRTLRARRARPPRDRVPTHIADRWSPASSSETAQLSPLV